ncbi:MAG: DUF192 domain-containing protein [Salinibacter sp.]
MPDVRLPLLAVLLLVASACGSETNTSDNTGDDTSFQQEGTLTFYQPAGDTLASIAIEIAETDAERKRGLMERRSLGYDRGMLFIFDETSTDGMWMKNTPLPLDIVFVSPDSQVIDIARRTTPFSEETIEPDAPRKFVVEVRAGFANRFGLSDSTRVHWTPTS